MQTGRARSRDLSIFYRRMGRSGATPLLIVHGLSYFSYDWMPVAEELGRQREVLAMDMRGVLVALLIAFPAMALWLPRVLRV